MGWRRWTGRAALAMAGMGLLSCGVSGGDGDTSSEDRLSEAWRRYRQGQYESAASLFEELALDDVELAESYGGLGWSRLRLLNASGARQAFQSSLVADGAWIDSRVGELFALRDAGGGADALLNRAREVLRADPDWRFSQENRVDWRDVQVLSAQVFYYTQRFDSCLVHLLAVDDAIVLSQADTLSWQGAPSYEAALLAELERVGQWVTE